MGDGMTQLREELEKSGVYAGPTVSCDARPAADKEGKKRKRAKPTYHRTKPVAVRQLVDEYGYDEVADMLGMSSSGLSTAVSRGDVSVTVERLAEQLILNEGKTVMVKKTRLVIARVPNEHHELVRNFLNALDIRSYDFAE